MPIDLKLFAESACSHVVDIWNPTGSALAAQCWVSKSGKSGFSPICRKKFNRSAGCRLHEGIRCRQCPVKDYLALTPDMVRKHVSGQSPKHRMGIFPVIEGNLTAWVAADLDNHDHTKAPVEDLRKLIETCTVLDVPIDCFTSNSGRGFHVYIFFDAPLPARKARMLLLTLLDRSGVDISHRRDKAGSFDCLFPKQDVLKEGEIGNLIALPYFGGAIRERGATLLLGPGDLEPVGSGPQENFEIFLETRRSLSDVEVDGLLSEMGPDCDAGQQLPASSSSPADRFDLAQLIEKCSFLRHCKQDAPTLPEPDWYLMICTLARQYRGPALIHELSRDYPGYSREECQQKINHALNDQPGPITCRKIKEVYECGKECGVTCPVHLIGGKSVEREYVASSDPEEELTRLLARAAEGSDEAPFDAVPHLAALSQLDDMRWRMRFKSAMGKRLNLNLLSASIREERDKAKRHRKSVQVLNPGMPVIDIGGGQLWEITEKAMAAIRLANSPPSLFTRSGFLARIRVDETGRPFIEQMSEPAMRGHLARCARWVRETEGGQIDEFPPRSVVQDVLSLHGWDLTPLEGVIETPIIRPGGTVLSSPGYDSQTRLFYFQAGGFRLPPLPGNPTQFDARSAAELILTEVLADFPFKDPASRTNALALLLTPILRHAINGKVPLALVDAPQAGSGKSLLAEIISLVTTGRSAAMATAPDSRRGDDDEWRKRITSLLRDGGTVIIIDNVEGTLMSPALASALTSDTWSDRILGRNEHVTLPQRATWLCTGNNIKLGSDLPRRCYWIRLDARMARPWQRSGFRHPDLVSWVLKHRGDLVSALLCMGRAWFVAGGPPSATSEIGSFENWTRIIGGILGYAGVPGFLSNLEELYEESDDESLQWEGFLASWHDLYGERAITVGELTADILKPDGVNETLKDSLPGWLSEALGRSTGAFKRSLGTALSKRMGVQFANGLTIEKDVPHRSRAIRWKVVSCY